LRCHHAPRNKRLNIHSMNLRIARERTAYPERVSQHSSAPKEAQACSEVESVCCRRICTPKNKLAVGAILVNNSLV
jgi:hypothetical protein